MYLCLYRVSVWRWCRDGCEVPEPINENCNAGWGGCDGVSTFTFSCFSFSLVDTPNFCSSSIINKPKSLNATSLPTKRCVPTSISILPSFNSDKMTFLFFSCASTTQIIYFARKIRQSLAKCIVLCSKHCGYSNLFAICSCFKCSTNCYFSFSKTNIATPTCPGWFSISLYICSF